MINDKPYDLEERTAVFAEKVIILCKKLIPDIISKPIIIQLIRSATSIGANYLETNGASSKRDFINKIHICKKESQETRHWLRLLMTCCPEKKTELEILQAETKELSMIFHKICVSTKNGSK